MSSADTLKGWAITQEQACSLLSSGHIVSVPTETVYGLAGVATSDTAIQGIYHLKKRPAMNPLIVHYACWQDTDVDVVWQPWSLSLAKSAWPGPLTFVLPKHPDSRLSPHLTSGLNTVAIRVPSHPLMKELIKACHAPLAAPSANLSGELSPTTAQHVMMSLAVPVLDGGPCLFGLESTIIDATGPHPVLLRHGSWMGEGDLLSSNLSNCGQKKPVQKEHVSCPGQLLAHYAPKKPIRMNATQLCDQEEGLLAFGPPCDHGQWMVQLSTDRDLHQAAANLFSGLFELDHTPCHSIAVMPIPMQGIGHAINDRLARACHGSDLSHS